ncbi:MAG: MBL fold metallo-hydrolase [Candidatus Schekmanbacteria bacterium]|nr:MAG: MBL fold metallo-hydrolase [Candidatus Schekmanbacteria bacterium]
MERKRIAVDCFTVGPFMENCFILSNEEGKAVVVDPGDESEKIISHLEKNNLTPLVLLATHAHIDHIGAVEDLKKRYSVPFVLHKDDEGLLKMADEQSRMVGLSFGDIPEVDIFLKNENEVLTFDNFRFDVIHTPGHTRGGVCYKISDILFSGDTLFRNSIGRTDFPGGSYSQIMDSIINKIVPLGDDIRVFCGHGPDTTIGIERKNNPFILDPEQYKNIL